MAYTALYRKWRPAVFEDVKGQDHIVTTLKNQIRSGRIGHAYLFCGTRGTGKTTVAKILARAVNCENPEDGNPCGECPACRAILAGASMNVAEIDAASNNGVDNIREIREEVQYSPADGRYRVYIIDEAHMLTPGAFNALLKTLEEPPSYVIFILATTEPHRIPITVLSRCQRYDFRRITGDVIYERLREMADAERIEAQEKALRFVAKKGDGSLRDAISLLDQCVAFYYGKELTYDRVLDVLGAVDNEVYSRMLRYALAGETLGCVDQVEELIVQGRELGQFVTDFIWYLRNLMLVKASEGEEEVLEMTAEDIAALKDEATITDMNTIMRYIRIFSELSSQMRYAANKRVLLEMALIRVTKPAMEEDLGSVLQRLGDVERKLEEGAVISTSREPKNAPEENSAKDVSEKKEVVEVSPAQLEDLHLIEKNWKKILRDIGDIMLPAMADCTLEPVGEGTLRIWFTTKGKYRIGSREDCLARLADYVRDNYGKEIVFVTQLAEDGQKPEKTYVSREEVQSRIHMDIIIEEE
ncbi:MAG: DNA polymerase III subunit gamma/tau [Lachnospiraceae bacterium]|nr:DNA polymerase III subunit gamma/tau [Lachnospiraceae bacterium]